MPSSTIVWLRRDLRLSDHAALTVAARRGPVIPVFILDEHVEGWGAAAKLRLQLGLQALQDALRERGLQLVLRRGEALDVLTALVRDGGSDAVFWSRSYDPTTRALDMLVKRDLCRMGVEARGFTGSLLFEPWTVQSGKGAEYRVYSPFWRSVRGRGVNAPLPEPALRGPERWPASDRLQDWNLAGPLNRGAAIVSRHVHAGERTARNQLDTFCATSLTHYGENRDRLDRAATSGLSEALTLGEISPATCWHAGLRCMQSGVPGAEKFLQELVWREFAWHLLWHFPGLATQNWKPEWDSFNWSKDRNDPGYVAWCRGQTGVPLVDAAMRELYVTGRMHNRARMVTASFLTKHLRVHWRLGLEWFQDCLIDWDPASNAMGWQWVAGSGPDAAPFFRIFNPETQADKFDPDGAYRRRWLELDGGKLDTDAIAFFAAAPISWGLDPGASSPEPIVDLRAGRAEALAAYERFKTQ